MTTELFDSVLVDYCHCLDLPLHITFVKNPKYKETNYIYSIYCVKEHLGDDIILMHGDMVFENEVFDKLIACEESCMAVNLPFRFPKRILKPLYRMFIITFITISTGFIFMALCNRFLIRYLLLIIIFCAMYFVLIKGKI